jgi:SAM-dependent methyltransferase
MEKELEKQYFEEEYKRSLLEYKRYLDALEEVFDFSIINNFLDLGCNNARLIEAIQRKYGHIEVQGVDYFQWSKDYADPSVREKIQLKDLAQVQDFSQGFDMVNCSEVGEHIEKHAENVFLGNLAKATKHILVLTWSNKPSLGNEQHQNPRSQHYIIRCLHEKGLNYWPEASRSLSYALEKNLGGIGYGWWAENIMVFRKVSFIPINSAYYIQQINTSNVNHGRYFLKKGLYKYSLQEAFIRLTQTILSLSAQRKSASILRASDGDYFFIRKIAIGSAKPGRRALTKEYDAVNIPLFRRLFWQNDIITISIEKPAHKSWKKYIFYELVDPVLWKFKFKIKGYEGFKVIQHVLDPIFTPLSINPWFLHLVSVFVAHFKGRGYRKKSLEIINKTYIPMEAVYALVATKWVFRNFKNQIGIIGGGPKLELIKLLMEHKEYRDYIGTDSFTDYVEIPQIGAADDITALAEKLAPRITSSQAKIFLVASGSSKIGLMPLLKAYSDAIFIDVGCGVDALAGVLLQTRPYFADWTNYRLKNFDYSKVDFMDQGAPEWSDKSYKTVWLDN